MSAEITNSKKILLIFPGEQHVKDVNLPLALLFIAKPLLAKGYKVEIFDCRIKNYKDIVLDNVLCVGLSVMSGPQIRYAIETAKHIRKINPKIPIIWGGPHPTSLPEQTAQSKYADIVVQGEGEKTFTELVERLKNNSSFEDVRGITYKKGSSVISTEKREFIDMNEIGLPPYELLDLNLYPNIYDKFEYLSSKGCPHNCGFCSNEINYRRIWRAKSPEVVISELEEIMRRFKPRYIVIIDANFFVDRKRVEAICRKIIEKKWDIYFYAMIRCDYVAHYDNSFIQLIRRAGFKELAFGAESGSARLLKFVDKAISVNQIIKAVEIFRDNKIKPLISFILGLPTETTEELEMTLKLYDKIMKIHPAAIVNGLFIFTPYPAARLSFFAADNFGYKFPKTLEEWASWRFSNKSNMPWVEKKVRNKYEAIYIISRLFFVNKLLDSWSFKQKLVRHGNTTTVILSVMFNKFFLFFAKLRWRFRIFVLPLELNIWYYFYYKFKGMD